ncbi:TerB family tellurite resistance protein [Cellulophaga baltica]|uniref:TerB family tellurite resistance protein n=1 Tax=Cellulophaga TaxID=104264 RepID=UPI001C07C443|nr:MULTISPECIES: TerB family tellurite resistance protein [Cellulophaga]MBU2997523.1 TerB family tellurite resistance protein [Cellulophaga baltica]MDO6768918.1 TerB family tellurite resistance protein [Cellulophaga sp. 1_MG-2023]
MIIFGTTGIKSTIKSGDFHCPQCEQSKPYRHRKVTKFFTLYFIPLIPLGSAGEYVECGNCKGTYILRVLNNNANSNNEQFMATYEKAIRHSMVLIMLADGVIDNNEKKQVLKIINKFGKNDLTMSHLENYIEQVKKEKEDVTTYLKKVGPSLNDHGKEVIIKCAISVAAADGNIDESELLMINKMAKAMQMSSAHVKGIFTEMFGESKNN